MRFSKLKFAAMTAFVALLGVTSIVPPAQADIGPGVAFSSATAECMVGAYTLEWQAPKWTAASPQLWFGIGQASRPRTMNFRVVAVLAEDGTILAEQNISLDIFGDLDTTQYTGTLWISEQAEGAEIRFELYDVSGYVMDSAPAGIFGGPSVAMARGSSDPWLLDQITVEYAPCSPDLPDPVPGARPGPEMIVLDGGVVGRFESDTPLYYAPDLSALVYPQATIKAGQTLWVFGVDETGEFYQVLVWATKLWVPVGAVGPNPDAPWNGAPLPSTVID